MFIDQIADTTLLRTSGHGANMAILDAIKLADVLAGQEKRSTGLEKFYDDRWQAWHEGVDASKKEIIEMHRGTSTSSATSNL